MLEWSAGGNVRGSDVRNRRMQPHSVSDRIE
jgi:hypothetical protein